MASGGSFGADDLREALRQACLAEGVQGGEVHLDRPARPEHGDWASNIALSAAKAAGRQQRELADALAARMAQMRIAHLAGIDVAGPGFLDFRLDPSWFHDVLREVIRAGVEGFGRQDVLEGRRINVEFVSANPTGPLHAGGGRWAAYGDCLCRLLERCGAVAHREYYLNDRGVQIGLFGESLAAARVGREPPEGGYHGDYVAEWAAEMPIDAEPVEWGYERAKRDIAETLARMNVHVDSWTSERSLVASGAVEDTLSELRARKVVYEADGAVWFRSSSFGDDKDRVLVKSDGEPTYLLPDIAYHRDKFGRGFDQLIDVLGADHHGYVGRLRASVQALGHRAEDLEVVLGQLVSLEQGGRPIRLSKRAGDMVALSDLLDAVGPDVTRLVFLLQSIDTHQRIDLDVVTAQSTENPVFYIQYAHARIASLGREAAKRGVIRLPIAEVDLAGLAHAREFTLLRLLADLPYLVLDACLTRSPHKVTGWARDLARGFHGFYHDCPVLRTDVPDALRQARLWLVEATRIGLAVALDLLGVSAPDIM